MSKVKNVFKCVKNIICWSFIVILITVVIFTLYTKINGNVPTVFGYSILRVSSGSMSPELEVGDVIISKDVENADELKLDDVITFYGQGATEGILVTHKVIKSPYVDENGITMLQTKGVANEFADDEISYDRVKSVMVCKISFLATLYSFFLSPWGLIIFIFLLLIVFVDEIINIVKILTSNDEIENKKDINDIIENIKNSDN